MLDVSHVSILFFERCVVGEGSGGGIDLTSICIFIDV